MAQGQLPLPEGGGRKVEQHVDAMGQQRTDRIGPRQPVPLQLLLHPEVFADGEPEPPAPAPPLQLQHRRLIAGAEIAPLIEDVVAGQQLLAGDDPPAAALHQRQGVVEVGLVGADQRLGNAHQQGEIRRQGCREAIEGDVLPFDQGRPQQQIPRRIAPQRQLRGEHQIGPALGRLMADRQDAAGVAVEVAHQGIELGQGEAHRGGGGAQGAGRP